LKDHKKSILNKFYIVGALMTLLLFAVFLKIIDLQYFKGDRYRQLSTDLTIRQDTVYANKGNLYASDGSLLATSMSKFTIRMDVMSVDKKVFQNEVVALAKELSKLLGKSSSYYKRILQSARRKGNRYLLLARNVGYNDYVKMKQFPIFKLGVYKGGFIAEQKTVREHPLGKIAERTIGYHDFRGKAGLEGAFSENMIGENGVRWKQKIAKQQWKPINDANEVEPIDGMDVITTIDVNMQDIAHHALLRQLEYFEAEHGCAVVMEVKTGEVKAIANLGRTNDGKYFEKRNYAIWESHEPGSTFKLASLMAALEDGYIDTSTVVDTEKGKIFIHNRKVEDSEKGGHGKISAARVFEVSSNVGIVKLIKKHYDHQPEKFIESINRFGLADKIGFSIKGEGAPYVPSPTDKKRWNKISLEWMSWGYGVSVTPMQTLMFYNAVANKGKMVKPRFVKALRRQNKTFKEIGTEVVNPQIASEETLKKVKKVMEDVVVKGTADNIYSPDFSMAGKTGTAKKWIPTYTNKEGEKIYGHYSSKHYVASFAGFFPVDNPKYSCIVVVHDPSKSKGYYGAIVAAPVFKEIAQKIYTSTPKDHEVVESLWVEHDDKSYQKKYQKLINQNQVKMPNLIGMSGMDAVSLLENLGAKVRIDGVGRVKQQSLKKGERITKGSVINLKLS